jgi:hypothetical protein
MELPVLAFSHYPLASQNDLTTYMVFKVRDGGWYTPNLDIQYKPNTIHDGGSIVSFETYKEARWYADVNKNAFGDMIVVECTIPQYTKYYVGSYIPKWGEYVCYISDTIKTGKSESWWERLVKIFGGARCAL